VPIAIDAKCDRHLNKERVSFYSSWPSSQRVRDLSAMIIVKDDFFKADIANLIEKGTEAYQWLYHHKSDTSNPAHNKFFVSALWRGGSTPNFFHILWKLIHKELSSLQGYECWRIIANGQVKGQNGNWHTDHGDKTIIYYPTAWKPEWGGSTFFRIDSSKKEIQYKKNRLVIFNSSISHYGSCPTVDNILRVSIAFNLRLKTTADELPKEALRNPSNDNAN
jgi:hypothetical protein